MARNPDPERRGYLYARLRMAVVLLLAAVLAAAAHGSGPPGFKVLAVTTHSRQGKIFAAARIAFHFSDEAREALENGVAMTVFVDLEVRTPGLLWNTTLASRRAGWHIQIHALSKQYRVKNLYTGRRSTYRSFDVMTTNIGMIQDLPLIEERLLDEDRRQRLHVRASLDVESLPSPLRPLAYVSAAWQLSSDWTSWPLQP